MLQQIAPVPLLEHDWSRSLVARALARAFTPPPDKHIWEWADETVLLQNEDAAEPGEYRSSKTPWTRRIQELIRHPFMWAWDYHAAKYVRVAVTEVNVKKSSQSGFSEACLNGIRWKVTYRPCNTIYAIDSAEEAKKIARRLLRSFKFLDSSIFTGDPDDIKTVEFQLRGMELLFYGSFSTGKFANKQAPFTISDEVEEHGKFILNDLASRKKTSSGGIQINLSKPKLTDGPIDAVFKKGNQEHYHVPCPHCSYMQPLTFFSKELEIPYSEEMVTVIDPDTGESQELPVPLPLGEKRKIKTGRLVFDHCKNLLGQWDRLRVLRETWYECASCQGKIEETSKRWMLDRATWRPMECGATPGIVSQQMTDLLSEDELSTWGRIALQYLDAKHSRSGTDDIRDFYNHRLGEAFSASAATVVSSDILQNRSGRSLWFVDAANSEGQLVRNIFHDAASAERLSAAAIERGEESPVIHSVCPAYIRGTIPWMPYRARPDTPANIVLGSDVGGNYAVWVVVAVHPNLRDLAVIDWGEELDPASIHQLLSRKTWPVAGTSVQCRLTSGWIDARWRPDDVYKACLASRGLIIPTKGLGGASAAHVKLWSYVHVPSYHPKFCELHYNDQRAKSALYLERIKLKRRRIWFPMDVEDDPDFIEQCSAERQTLDRRGKPIWDDESDGPNHFGDALKEAVLGIDFMLRNVKAPDQEG